MGETNGECGMKREHAEEFTRGLTDVLKGGWMLVANAEKMGVPEALGLSLDQWQRRIGGPVQLLIEERQRAARELTAPDGEYRFSNRKAAKILNVSRETINKDVGGKKLPPEPPDTHNPERPRGKKLPPEPPPLDTTARELVDAVQVLYNLTRKLPVAELMRWRGDANRLPMWWQAVARYMSELLESGA